MGDFSTVGGLFVLLNCSIFSYYEGGRPVLVTSDPDWAKEVLVKKFSNFAARKVEPSETGKL